MRRAVLRKFETHAEIRAVLLDTGDEEIVENAPRDMGVGSSVIAAIKHNRHGYGCDIVQRYVDIAWTRVEQLRAGTLKMRPMDRPIYDPALPNGGQKRVERMDEGNDLQLSFC